MSFFETKKLKRGGSNIIITLPIYQKKRRLFLIFKILINFLKTYKRKKIPFSQRLAGELLLLYFKRGKLYKQFQKNKEYSIAQQPYLHYRWE